MSTDREPSPDPRDVDAEFARMLEGEGLELRPGEAPREPAAPERPRPSDGSSPAAEGDSLWSFSADSPSAGPSMRQSFSSIPFCAYSARSSS